MSVFVIMDLKCKYTCQNGPTKSCRVSCWPPGMKGIWTVHPEAYARVTNLVLTRRNESAGTLKFHKDPRHNTRYLTLGGDLVEGERDNVDVPVGAVEFHTHPSKCGDGDSECGIDVPSPEDIGLLLNGMFRGCLAHIVFASTGSYVMQPLPKLVQAIDTYGDKHVAGLISAFERLFEDEPKKLSGLGNKAFLNRFRRAWMELANVYKLQCCFYPSKDLPKVRV